MVSKIPGIGPKYQSLLKSLEITTVENLLWHIPFRYDDFSNIKNISELIANEPATIIGEIIRIDNIFTRNYKKLTRAVLEDKTGKIDLIWFNQHYIKQSLKAGTKTAISGILSLNDKGKRPQIVNPQWEIHKGKLTHTGGLVPVYPLTNGITSKWLRSKIKFVLENTPVDNIISHDLQSTYNLLDKAKAFEQIHFPKSLEASEKARHSLAFEELLFLHLRGLQHKKDWNKKVNGHKITMSSSSLAEFTRNLPFKLTQSQEKVTGEILKDLGADLPMNRLLQGDVGSGKTVVAAASLLAAAQSGCNSILLAPTQILAEQHFETLQKLLKNMDCEIEILTAAASRTSRAVLTGGQLKLNKIIVSTHAILHNLDKFSNVGLIIIDEQHKFGVSQRTKIIEHYTDKLTPNLLTMTATPIPRSLALTFYGDLDLSFIDEMPVGRKSVKTRVITEKYKQSAYEWIKKKIDQEKTQVFVVCPFIEQSMVENLQNVKAAQKEYEKVSEIFKGMDIGLLHGRMKSTLKDSVVNNFLNKKLDILVATPVIEVGVDIPNANIIMIETAERFGLASLHQMRGRVGRGGKQGYCLLVYSGDSRTSWQRLKNLETIHNGNKLAEIDLKNRGPGNLYGTKQHGYLKFKVADGGDFGMIKETRQTAIDIFHNLSAHPKIAAHLDSIQKVKDN